MAWGSPKKLNAHRFERCSAGGHLFWRHPQRNGTPERWERCSGGCVPAAMPSATWNFQGRVIYGAGLDLATSRLSARSRGIHFNLSHTRASRVPRDAALSRTRSRRVFHVALRAKKYDTLRVVHSPLENRRCRCGRRMIEGVINYGHGVGEAFVTLVRCDSPVRPMNFYWRNLSLFRVRNLLMFIY